LTTSIPFREPPSLAATRNDRSAVPCPEAGDSDEIQLTVVEASHVHSGSVAIASDPEPPRASIIGGVASLT
jgi:hypothetical protein